MISIFKKVFVLFLVFISLFGFAKNLFASFSDGTEDVGFYTKLGSAFGGGQVFDVVLEPDGQILVGGSFTTFDGKNRNGLVRLNQDGSEDVGFYQNLGIGFEGEVYSLAIQSDGKILVGGRYFFNGNYNIKRNLVRLNSTGLEDNNFTQNIGSGFNANIYSLAIQSDGKILVGGIFSIFNNNSRKYLVRLNSTGLEDTAFYSNFGNTSDGGVRTIALNSNGQILIGGTFSSTSQSADNFDIRRIESNGSEDLGFYNNLPIEYGGNVYSIAVDSSNKILVGGNLGTNLQYSPLLRLNSNGTKDSSFVLPGEFDNFINSLAIQSDGKILVGGRFTQFNNFTRNRLVRLESNGAEDVTFANNLENGFGYDLINDIVVQPDGKILVAGDFTSFNNQTRNNLIRLSCCKVPSLPPAISLSATPSNVAVGGATNLTWTVTNATTCTASGGWSGSKSPNGGSQIVGNLQSNTTFTLSCSGDGGTSEASVNVTVGTNLPVVNLSALPLAIPVGGSTRLTWSSTNANTCTASAIPANSSWTGSKNPAGAVKTISNLTQNTTFTLSCSGDGGTSEASVSVTVDPKPVINFIADPSSVSYNSFTDLTWTVTNATTCTASGGWSGSKNSISGTEKISNLTQNTTFTLSCSGAGGNTINSVNVTVSTPNPTVSLNASPSNVSYGGYTSLSWTVTNATTCTASGGWSGSKSPNGSQPILTPLTVDTTFTLSCSGFGGTSENSVVVTVLPQAPLISISANPTLLSVPGNTDLTWTVTNATTCTASGGWSGSKNSISGTEKISNLTQNTTFTLSCSGDGGTSENSVNVTTVAIPTVKLNIDKKEILPGEDVILSWEVSNADSCIATSNPNHSDWNGNQAFSDGIHTKAVKNINNDTSFSLVCNNSGGTANSSVSVKLIAEKLTFNNTKVLYDSNTKQYKTKLSWVANNVKECVASTNSDDSEINDSWSGNKASSPNPYQGETQNVIVKSVLPEVTKYTLSCKGLFSDKIISVSRDLHTKSLASSGVGIPDYEEN